MGSLIMNGGYGQTSQLLIGCTRLDYYHVINYYNIGIFCVMRVHVHVHVHLYVHVYACLLVVAQQPKFL